LDSVNQRVLQSADWRAGGAGFLNAASKQVYPDCPTNACLDPFVFAEFFSKTGKIARWNSAWSAFKLA
jgi:hypothetical protein